ncbi:inositol monophosphatase family protein [Streptomyces sp. NPDC102476]|uniref:inositol monophosphatase family protein n=1 Tax=Streptomyces sp. NPDC102476 TaxID=3366181 RepID=UPI00382E73FD
MSEYPELLEIACRAVGQAAKLVTGMPIGSVTSKGDRDMASEIDYAVEDWVRTFLLSETPEIGFRGEENGDTGVADKSLVWVLDPVDGTANLLNGLPLCAVSLGLVEGQRSVLGVVALPFMDLTYQAADGLGAYCGGSRVQPSVTADMGNAIVSMGDYAVGEGAQLRNRRRLALTAMLAQRAMRVRMLGSAAIDLVWVASGKLDASVALSNRPWDMAAGTAVAREAGALVLDVDGTPHDITSSATVSVTPALKAPLMQLLSSAGLR